MAGGSSWRFDLNADSVYTDLALISMQAHHCTQEFALAIAFHASQANDFAAFLPKDLLQKSEGYGDRPLQTWSFLGLLRLV
jgi:hypothetical protein